MYALQIEAYEAIKVILVLVSCLLILKIGEILIPAIKTIIDKLKKRQ